MAGLASAGSHRSTASDHESVAVSGSRADSESGLADALAAGATGGARLVTSIRLSADDDGDICRSGGTASLAAASAPADLQVVHFLV